MRAAATVPPSTLTCHCYADVQAATVLSSDLPVSLLEIEKASREFEALGRQLNQWTRILARQPAEPGEPGSGGGGGAGGEGSRSGLQRVVDDMSSLTNVSTLRCVALGWAGLMCWARCSVRPLMMKSIKEQVQGSCSFTSVACPGSSGHATAAHPVTAKSLCGLRRQGAGLPSGARARWQPPAPTRRACRRCRRCRHGRVRGARRGSSGAWGRPGSSPRARRKLGQQRGRRKGRQLRRRWMLWEWGSQCKRQWKSGSSAGRQPLRSGGRQRYAGIE